MKGKSIVVVGVVSGIVFAVNRMKKMRKNREKWRKEMHLHFDNMKYYDEHFPK
jgi:hypothetical protein